MKITVKRIMTLTLAVLMLCANILPASAESGNPLTKVLDMLLSGLTRKQTPAVMPHEETVASLREMGIAIPDQAVVEVETFFTSYRQELTGIGITRDELPHEFVTALLMFVGMGDYDYDTGKWTPTSSEVYAFDAEVFDVDHMYRLFLEGVSAIAPGFEPTDVQETIDEKPVESNVPNAMPEGTTTVSFTLHGKRFEKTLEFYGDWFNDGAIAWVNEIFAGEGFDGQLHSFYDGGQGLILLYGNAEHGERLRAIIPEPRF